MRVDGGGGRWRVRVGVGVEWRVERDDVGIYEIQLTTAILKAGDKCKYPLANRPDEYILLFF